MSRMCRRQEAFLVLDSSFGMNCVNRFETFFLLRRFEKRKKKRTILEVIFFLVPSQETKVPSVCRWTLCSEVLPWVGPHVSLSLSSNLHQFGLSRYSWLLSITACPPVHLPPAGVPSELRAALFSKHLQLFLGECLFLFVDFLWKGLGCERGLCDWSVRWPLTADRCRPGVHAVGLLTLWFAGSSHVLFFSFLQHPIASSFISVESPE